MPIGHKVLNKWLLNRGGCSSRFDCTMVGEMVLQHQHYATMILALCQHMLFVFAPLSISVQLQRSHHSFNLMLKGWQKCLGIAKIKNMSFAIIGYDKYSLKLDRKCTEMFLFKQLEAGHSPRSMSHMTSHIANHFYHPLVIVYI